MTFTPSDGYQIPSSSQILSSLLTFKFTECLFVPSEVQQGYTEILIRCDKGRMRRFVKNWNIDEANPVRASVLADIAIEFNGLYDNEEKKSSL